MAAGTIAILNWDRRIGSVGHRYSLRKLMILLAIGPPMLAGLWTVGSRVMAEYRVAQEREIAKRHIFMKIGPGIRIVDDLPDGQGLGLAQTDE